MPEAAVGDDLEAFTSDVNLVDRLLPELSRASTALQTLASQQQALLDQIRNEELQLALATEEELAEIDKVARQLPFYISKLQGIRKEMIALTTQSRRLRERSVKIKALSQ